MDLEKQRIEREKFQEECTQLSKQHKHLLIEAATGVGKLRACLRCIAASTSTKKWLVVVPEILQIENYKQDMIKHGYEWMLGIKIDEIICYASLSKYRNRELNLHLNEVQYLSNARLDSSFTMKFDQIISDSATVSREVRYRLWELWPYHLIELSMTKAIELGILPKPKFHLVGIELNDSIRRNEKIIKGKTYKFTDLSTARGYDNQIQIWKDKKQRLIEEGKPHKWIDNKIIILGGMRKKFLAECKTEIARKLLGELVGKRLLVFCGSVVQSEELGGELSVNSSRGKKHNASVIERFNKGEIDYIFTNKMMKEGQNLTNIDGAIIIQLDSGNDEGLSIIQKSGRTFRSEDPEVWIIYCKNTHDEVFLKKALKSIDKQYICTM